MYVFIDYEISSFIQSPVCRGYISKVSVHFVQKYFPHDFSTDSISCSEREKRNLMKKYQNEKATSVGVTVSNLNAKKINTLLSLSIHQACRQSDAAFFVVFNPLDVSYILRRRIRCCCCSLHSHLPPSTPPSLL